MPDHLLESDVMERLEPPEIIDIRGSYHEDIFIRISWRAHIASCDSGVETGVPA
jgi:hypothetical protein